MSATAVPGVMAFAVSRPPTAAGKAGLPNVMVTPNVLPDSAVLAVAGCVPETGLNLLLVTEYARNTQAFAVESVENIVRLDWSQVHTAEAGIGIASLSLACGVIWLSRPAPGLNPHPVT